MVDILKSTIDGKEITAGSREISTMFGQLYKFEIMAFGSEDKFAGTMFAEQRTKIMIMLKQADLEIEISGQDQIRSIKS